MHQSTQHRGQEDILVDGQDRMRTVSSRGHCCQSGKTEWGHCLPGVTAVSQVRPNGDIVFQEHCCQSGKTELGQCLPGNTADRQVRPNGDIVFQGSLLSVR